MPAENEPAEPNALMQSLQLTCSLTPSSTLPSTRLVIIWLKRCPARSLIEPALESAPVSGGALVGAVLARGVDVWLGVGDGEADGVGVGDGLGVGVGELHSTHSSNGVGEGDCARAGGDCIASTATRSAAGTRALRAKFAMVSARTACRWDRCRRRR